MTSEARAFFAIDIGGATVSGSLIGQVGGRWRLIGSVAFPAGVGVDDLLGLLVERVRQADPEVADEIGAGRSVPAEGDRDGHAGGLTGRGASDRLGPAGDWARVIARSTAPASLAVVAATDRQAARLEVVAERSGWRTIGASLERHDALALTQRMVSREVGAVLLGSDDPPAADERSRLLELAEIAAAATSRRPELDIVLAGAMVDHARRFERVDADPGGPGRVPGARNGQGSLLMAPEATAGDPPGEPLRAILAALHAGPDDARAAIARATASLAFVLDRRVETIELGFDGGLRTSAWPGGLDSEDAAAWTAVVASAALVPPEPDDALVDHVLGWTTTAMDRHRLRDRLRELRVAPWAEAHGEGALLRLAAARAALGRLMAATPEFGALPAPDLVVASGGAWAVAPGPAIMLALADLVRRPGAVQYAFDHARLLAPIGAIEDEEDRRRLLADLAEDLLTPLGSVVQAQGLRAGKSAGRLIVHAGLGTSELDLVPGGLELVDLPAGQTATAEFRFRDPVILGSRGRRFAVDVSGGLGGLLIDLRDVPLRLPERPERRRRLLDAWQRALWTGIDA